MKKVLIATIFANLLWGSHSQAQVTQVSTAYAEANYANPNLTYTVGAGTDRCLIFMAGNEYDIAGNDIVTVSFGGIPMTFGAEIEFYTTNCWAEVEIWYILETDIVASSGSDFVVTYSTGTDLRAIKHSAITYEGVDQINPIGAIETATASSTFDITGPSITGDINDLLLTGISSGQNTTYTFDAGFVEIFDDNGGTHTYAAAEQSYEMPCPIVPTVTASGFQNRVVMLSMVLQADFNPVFDLFPDDTSGCDGVLLTLDATTAGATYLWSDGSSGATLDISTDGTYSVDVIIGGCTLSDNTNVTLITNPISFNDTTLCDGEIMILDATTAGATYLWQDGTTASTFNVTTTGTYTVDITNGGCFFTETSIVDYSGITFSFTDTDICQGDILVLDATTAGATYLWQDGTTTPIYNVSDAGFYSVDVIMANCIYTQSLNVNVIDVVPTFGDATICDGDFIVLDATQGGPSTYLWQDGSTSPTYPVTDAGTYSVDITIGACLFNLSANIGVTAIDFEFTDILVCNDDEILLSATTPGATYQWQDGSTNSTYSVTTDGEYTVEVTLDGCSFFQTTDVTYIIVNANFDYEVYNGLQGNEVQFTDMSTNAMEYYWEFGDGSTGGFSNPTHSYGAYGDYTVTLTVTNDICSDQITKIIRVDDHLIFYIPNTFTPDGDQYNDTFQPVFYSGFDPYDFHMMIFNRWGEIVFETYDASIGWQGDYGNRGLTNDGTYIWRIEFGDLNNDRRYYHEGHVTILK